jgi:hypothetical protein
VGGGGTRIGITAGTFHSGAADPSSTARGGVRSRIASDRQATRERLRLPRLPCAISPARGGRAPTGNQPHPVIKARGYITKPPSVLLSSLGLFRAIAPRSREPIPYAPPVHRTFNARRPGRYSRLQNYTLYAGTLFHFNELVLFHSCKRKILRAVTIPAAFSTATQLVRALMPLLLTISRAKIIDYKKI